MPRSVLVLSQDPNLWRSVRTVLGSDSRFIDTGGALHCDGSVAPLTNIYPTEQIEAEWEGWESEHSGLDVPASMSALIFETRSSAWVAEVGKLLAQGLKTTVWLVDSADKAWLADAIDPDRVALS